MPRPRAGRRAIATILLALNALTLSLFAAYVTNVVLSASSIVDSAAFQYPWSTVAAFLITSLVLVIFSTQLLGENYGLVSSVLKVVLTIVSFWAGLIKDRSFVYVVMVMYFDCVGRVYLPQHTGHLKTQALVAFGVFLLRTTSCRTDAAATAIGSAAAVGFVLAVTPILTVVLAGREVTDLLVCCVGMAMLASFTAMKQVFSNEVVSEAHNKLGQLMVATHTCLLTVSITTAVVVGVMMPIVPRNEAAVLLPAMKKVVVASILVMATVVVKLLV